MTQEKSKREQQSRFEEFYNYKPLVLRKIRESGLCDKTYYEINDIMQEIYCKVWLYIPSYDPKKGTVASYIRKISDSVIRNIIKELKTKKREDEIKVIYLSDRNRKENGIPIEDTLIDENNNMELFEDRSTVEFIFTYLTEEEKNIMRKRFYENKTMQTIGDELNVSKQWVFKVIARICRKFHIKDNKLVVNY